MYLNQHPKYRRRRAAALALAVVGGTLAYSAATAPDTHQPAGVPIVAKQAAVPEREADLAIKLRSVNIVPEAATELDSRQEAFGIAMDVKRTVRNPADAPALNMKITQHADRLQTRYPVTAEQGAYWVGAALRAYAPRYAATLEGPRP